MIVYIYENSYVWCVCAVDDGVGVISYMFLFLVTSQRVVLKSIVNTIKSNFKICEGKTDNNIFTDKWIYSKFISYIFQWTVWEYWQLIRSNRNIADNLNNIQYM